ncbi:MAG TPA: hypothetical protein VLM05_12445 [Mycobacteriales bacterium]|nr:hypothetical protein [Mycobacteriales bacterium]
MSNLNNPHELEQDADEITIPEGQDTTDDRPEHYMDPAIRGSESAAEPIPQDNAEQLESALREGAGFLRIADEDSVKRARQPTEDGPGTSLN